MKFKKVKNIKLVEKNATVYSPNVQDNHNYFTNGNLLSKNCLMILDEAQNADMRSLMLYTTRMGHESKVLIMGDISQTDLLRKSGASLPTFMDMLQDINGVGVHKFLREDIVRNKILIEVADKYEQWKYSRE